jgi:hypothetical protein
LAFVIQLHSRASGPWVCRQRSTRPYFPDRLSNWSAQAYCSPPFVLSQAGCPCSGLPRSGTAPRQRPWRWRCTPENTRPSPRPAASSRQRPTLKLGAQRRRPFPVLACRCWTETSKQRRQTRRSASPRRTLRSIACRAKSPSSRPSRTRFDAIL